MAPKDMKPVVSAEWHPSFGDILGAAPTMELVADTADPALPLFHEARVYHAPSRSVFVTSNQLPNAAGEPYEPTGHRHVRLTRVYADDDGGGPRYEEVTFPGARAAMLNGGVNHGPDHLLLCAQGSRAAADLSGLVRIPVPPARRARATGPAEVVVADFYGLTFNSVNDVVVHPRDGALWFTDPCYGAAQGIRPAPALPGHVYRFEPAARSLRAVAAGFVRPNGLCFAPDARTLYVTDTGALDGRPGRPLDPAGPSHIYAFTVRCDDTGGAPRLVDRRLFAYAPGRLPDGIKCDTRGNVYAGCGDGIEVWDPHGTPLGVIKIEGGVANFCFGEKGVLWACNEQRFWKVALNPELVRGALLGL